MKKSLVFRIWSQLWLLHLHSLLLHGGSGESADQPEPEPQEEQPAPKPEPAETEDEPAPAEKREYAIVYPVIHQFFDPVTEGAEAYAEELGNIDLIIQAPEAGSVQQQIEIMENLISMKVDGIAIGSTDPEALAPLY